MEESRPAAKEDFFPKLQEVCGGRTLLLFHGSKYVMIKTQKSFGS